MREERKYTNPPIFSPAITMLPTGAIKAVSYWLDEDGTINLERAPVLGLAIIPDWESVSYAPDSDGERHYNGNDIPLLYSVKAIGLAYDGAPTYFEFIDDGTTNMQWNFLGYDDGMFDEEFWMKTAEEAKERAEKRKLKKEVGE